jgi:hypothetical protein
MVCLLLYWRSVWIPPEALADVQTRTKHIMMREGIKSTEQGAFLGANSCSTTQESPNT